MVEAALESVADVDPHPLADWVSVCCGLPEGAALSELEGEAGMVWVGTEEDTGEGVLEPVDAGDAVVPEAVWEAEASAEGVPEAEGLTRAVGEGVASGLGLGEAEGVAEPVGEGLGPEGLAVDEGVDEGVDTGV